MHEPSALGQISSEYIHLLLIRTVKSAANSQLDAPIFAAYDDPILPFFSTHTAEIKPEAYVARIKHHAHCSNSVFVYAVAILNRLEILDGRLAISPFNMHRLLITAVMISAKFLDNAWYSSNYYARVGGISSVQEMNHLELCMLRLLDYRIFLPVDEILYVLEGRNDDGSPEASNEGAKKNEKNYCGNKQLVFV